MKTGGPRAHQQAESEVTYGTRVPLFTCETRRSRGKTNQIVTGSHLCPGKGSLSSRNTGQIHFRVLRPRPGSDPDRTLVAQLTGTARRHARWRELTEAEEAAAVNELRELAAGHDLLASWGRHRSSTGLGDNLREPFLRVREGVASEAG